MRVRIESKASTSRRAVATPEPVGFVLLTLAVLGFYWLVRAPVLNPSEYIDPWIYTATFTNYHFLHTTFPSAYYPTRLPWIIPGIAVNSVLSPVPAFFFLHLLFFVSGGLFAFLLLRRYFGSTAAFLGYAVLMLSPLFYDAYSNDYPDGALLTYLLGGAYFALSAWGSRRRALRLALGGFFLAAAVGTNLLTGAFVVGLTFVYLAVFTVERGFLWSFARDAAAVVAGGLVVLVGCGIFSRADGGEFLFFMPSVRAIGTLNSADYKLAGYGWLSEEPQLLLPAFALAALAVLVPMQSIRRWKTDATVRFAIGSGAFLAFTYTGVCVWEFAYTGNLLETRYYFSLFNAPLALVVGAVLFYASRPIDRAAVRAKALIVSGCAFAVALPTFLLFRLGFGFVGERAAAVTLLLMAVSLLLLAAVRFTATSRAVVGVTAIVFVLFTVGYSASGGILTQSFFRTTGSTYGERRQTLSLAMQLIRFMKDNHLQRTTPGSPATSAPPAFWYDNSVRSELNGIQSTYLWATTAIGFDMPHFDTGERTLLEQRRPLYVVLLCTSPSCEGGPAALERAGYRLRPKARTVIAAGGSRYWVAAYRIPKFKVLDEVGRYYQPAQSPLASSLTGTPLWRVSFARGLPDGWSGSATVVPGTPARATTEARLWAYSVVSPEQTLQPGTYRLYLSGKVLAGGLDLGALDLGANRWIAQSFYWFRQRGFGRGWMNTPFRLDAPTQVEVVLSNWVPSDQASRWELGELRLVRVP